MSHTDYASVSSSDRSYGAVVLVQCLTGYQLAPNVYQKNITCKLNQEWDSSIEKCTSKLK